MQIPYTMLVVLISFDYFNIWQIVFLELFTKKCNNNNNPKWVSSDDFEQISTFLTKNVFVGILSKIWCTKWILRLIFFPKMYTIML